MQPKRRFQFFGIFIVAMVFLVLGMSSSGQGEEKFPSRPVEVIVPTPPGGGTDLMIRVIAEAIEPFLGQKIIIINKTGAGGAIGMTAAAKSKPDGYTLVAVWASALTMTPYVTNVSFTLDDFTYITQLTASPIIFCCNSDFPAKDAKEFFEYAKKNPGKITYACDGIGATVHFFGERIFKAMNVKLRVVPFGGAGESIKALLGRHVDIYGGSVAPAAPHVKEGRIRSLFSATLEDVPELPGTVGLATLGHPEAASTYWRGMVAPKGLPEDRRLILEKALHKAAHTEMVIKRFEEWGEKVVTSSGKEFEAMVRAYNNTFAAIAEELGLAKK